MFTDGTTGSPHDRARVTPFSCIEENFGCFVCNQAQFGGTPPPNPIAPGGGPAMVDRRSARYGETGRWIYLVVDRHDRSRALRVESSFIVICNQTTDRGRGDGWARAWGMGVWEGVERNLEPTPPPAARTYMVAKNPLSPPARTSFRTSVYSQANRTAASIRAASASPSSTSGDLQPVGDCTLFRDRWFALLCGVFMVNAGGGPERGRAVVSRSFLGRLLCGRYSRKSSRLIDS